MGIKHTKQFNIIPELENIEYFDYETQTWKNMDNIPRTMIDMPSSEPDGLLDAKYTIKPVVIFDTGCFSGSIITFNLYRQMNLPRFKCTDGTDRIFENDVLGKCIFKFKSRVGLRPPILRNQM